MAVHVNQVLRDRWRWQFEVLLAHVEQSRGVARENGALVADADARGENHVERGLDGSSRRARAEQQPIGANAAHDRLDRSKVGQPTGFEIQVRPPFERGQAITELCVVSTYQHHRSIFLFSSTKRHTSCYRDWSSDVCSSD